MSQVRNRLGWLLFLLATLLPLAGRAQQDLRYPPSGYYLGFPSYFDGDYAAALRVFEAAMRSGIRSTEGRWVDSICYHTMAGECYYQMGETAKALEQYDAAAKLAVFHNNWMLRVQFPEILEASASNIRTTINWGVSKRPTALARIPDRLGTLQGQSAEANQAAIERGGTVALQQIFPLDVKEVVRCTAVALARRAELMGPMCKYDPLTAQLLGAFGARPTLPNHWSQAWVSCHLGLAYASAGKPEQAASELAKSLVLAGQFDHELTSLALLALARLAAEQGQHNVAADYFLEATFAAAAYDQFDVMQEAFQGGLVTHLVSGRPGLYAPLPMAAAWAQRKSRALQAWLLLAAAENYAQAGDAGQASMALAQARQAIGTREMRSGRVGCRFNYLAALVDFQQGKLATGLRSLDAALAFQKASSNWLMQIRLADAYYVSGGATQRLADELYSDLLREPLASDWTTQPLETLAVATTPHLAPLGHWFEVAMLRKDDARALMIADRIRRHHFHSTTAMGGRLLALRWILEAPEASLSQQAVQQRQDLLARYPKYGQLAAQAALAVQQLRGLPLVPEAQDQQRQQSQLLDQLGTISASQELILSNVALRREPAEFAFPPLLGLKEIQQRMPPGQLLLAYQRTSRSLTAFAVDKERIASWQVEASDTLGSRIADLLKRMGVRDRKQPLDAAQLREEGWQQASFELLRQLSNVRDPAVWSNYQEVVIVPDGPLWYVPFEALHIAEGPQGRPLISKVPVRYAPTASLANVPGGVFRRQATTAVVAGRLFPGQAVELTQQAAADIAAALPGTVPLHLSHALPAPSSLFSVTCDRLIVFDEVDQVGGSPYGWSPMKLERGKRGDELESWSALPWQGPLQIVLPGFHTAAETGLKGGTAGDEIFLGACGLMASGARSVLLSRWVLGGQSTFDLLREYAQELPYAKPADAWRRSVLLNAPNPIDPSREPRLRVETVTDEIRAAHPYFWSGYLLVDSGAQPAAPAAALAPAGP